VMGEDDPRDGSGFPSTLLGVVDMHPQRRGRSGNREHGPPDLPVELELVQAEYFAIELPCLVDVSDVDGHRFQPLNRRGHNRASDADGSSLGPSITR